MQTEAGYDLRAQHPERSEEMPVFQSEETMTPAPRQKRNARNTKPAQGARGRFTKKESVK